MKIRNFMSFLLIFAMFSQSVLASTYYVNSNHFIRSGVGYDCVVDNPTNDGNLCTFPLALDTTADLGGNIVFTDDFDVYNEIVVDDAGGEGDFSLDVNANTTIDANVESRQVGLKGNQVGLYGLGVKGNNVTIRGLRIHGFDTYGVKVEDTATENILIEDNVIGLDENELVSGNNVGVEIQGKDVKLKDNVISGNDSYGVSIGEGAGDIVIQGNKIGTDESGENPRPNDYSGISAGGSIAGDILIGMEHEDLSEGNIIKHNDFIDVDINIDNINKLEMAGNEMGSVYVDADNMVEPLVVRDNVVENVWIEDVGSSIGEPVNVDIKDNFVGVERHDEHATEAALVGTNAGITVNDGNVVTVKDNVVANNNEWNDPLIRITQNVKQVEIFGNKLGTLLNGLNSVGASSGIGIMINGANIVNVVIGGIGDLGNVIGNVSTGIDVVNLFANDTPVLIQGNYIGVGSDGQTTEGLALAEGGISLERGSVTIGGDNALGEDGLGTLGEGNVIANISDEYGGAIEVSGGGSNNVSSLQVVGNIIGLVKGAGGVYDVVAGIGSGMKIESETLSNLVVGAVGDLVPSSKRNMISGARKRGIIIYGLASEAEAFVKNNYIGTDWTGTENFGGDQAGIDFDLDFGNFDIGGPGENEGNFIIGHLEGIYVGEDGTGVSNILGNYISKSDEFGILVREATGGVVNIGFKLVGGVKHYAKNVIVENEEAGISIFGRTVNVLGNYIGIDSEGNTKGNLGGILVKGPENMNVTIGGEDNADERNIISGNYGAGVLVLAGDGVEIKNNYIGISPDGQTAMGNRISGKFMFPENIDGSGIIISDLLFPDEEDFLVASTNDTVIEGNFISGNEGSGIAIIHLDGDDFPEEVGAAGLGGGGLDWTGGYIKSNVLGFAADGETPLKNAGYGIYVMEKEGEQNITNLQIGGSDNLIETSDNYGIYLEEVESSALHGGYEWLEEHNIFSNILKTWIAIVGGVTYPLEEEEISTGGGSPFFPPLDPDPVLEPEAEEEDVIIEEDSEEEVVEEEVVEEEVSERDLKSEEEAREALEKTVSKVSDRVNDVFVKKREVKEDVLVAKEVVSELESKFLERKAEVKEQDVPFEYLEYNKGKKEVESSLELFLKEELSVLERTVATSKTTSLVESSLQEQLEKRPVVVNLGRGRTQEVRSMEEVNVVVDMFGDFTEKDIEKFKEQTTKKGQVPIVVTNDSDHAGDRVSDIVKMRLGLPIFELEEKKKSLSERLWMGLDLHSVEEQTERAYATVGFGDHAFDAKVSQNPFFRVVGEPMSEVDLILVDKDNYENQILLAEKLKIDEENKATFKVEDKLPLATYYVVVKEEEKFGNVSKIEVSEDVGDFEINELIMGGDLVKVGDPVIVGDPVMLEDLFSMENNPLLSRVFRRVTPVLRRNPGMIGDPVMLGDPVMIGRLFMTNSFRSITSSVRRNSVLVEAPVIGGDPVITGDPVMVFSGRGNPGDIIMFTWKSVILSSVVMSDASQGEFRVEVPDELPEGEHEIIAFSYNPRTGVVGNVVSLLFNK